MKRDARNGVSRYVGEIGFEASFSHGAGCDHFLSDKPDGSLDSVS